MRYNVLHFFERKNIDISNILYLTRQNPDTKITFFDGKEIRTAIPVKEIAIYLPDEEFVNITKGVLLRKSQIVNISDDGLYTMTDGSVFQGRKRNISQHKQLRQALGLSKEQDEKAENAEERKRRKAFYLRNGLKETGLFVNVYDTDFELLTPDGELTFWEYVDFLREVMYEEYVEILRPTLIAMKKK